MRFVLVFSKAGVEMSTFVPSGKDIARKFYVIDASGKTLGRLATKAADVLSGKLNPQYVPYIDVGDHVIVINAEKVRLTAPEGWAEALSPLHRIRAGCARSHSRRLLNRKPEMILSRPSRACCRRARWVGRCDQAEGLSRRQASAPGADAGGAGDCVRTAFSYQLSV